MLEYILIHALVLVNWWATPQIREYAGKHYVTYPMKAFFCSVVFSFVWGFGAGNIQICKYWNRRCSFDSAGWLIRNHYHKTETNQK